MKSNHKSYSGRLAMLAVAMACMLAAPASFADEAVAGVVKKMQGSVEIVRNGQAMPAAIGTKLQSGDVIKTQKDSGLGVMLKDESRLSVGANSQMALDKFAFNANTYEGSMVVNVLKGTFAMISGLLVKNNATSAQVKTPTSTAGIRGTYFVVDVP